MIKTEYMNICNERADAIRNQRLAYNYSLSVEVDREIKRERRKEVVIGGIVAVICITIMILATKSLIGYADKTYANTSDTTTEACVVTSVTEDLVTVSYDGNYYSFYGNGYEVGEMIICQFTSEMEIIDILE
jgi:hypothetical protein